MRPTQAKVARLMRDFQERDRRRTVRTPLGSRQRHLLTLLRDLEEPVSVEHAHRRLAVGITITKTDVQASLFGLEVRGLVKRETSGRFRLTDAGRARS